MWAFVTGFYHSTYFQGSPVLEDESVFITKSLPTFYLFIHLVLRVGLVVYSFIALVSNAIVHIVLHYFLRT